MSRRISIFDTTLRDGEQSPGIALQPGEKATIAEQLQRLGVDVVEAGFPGASPGDFEGVQAVARVLDGPTVAAFARAVREDIDAAGEALAEAGRSRIHVVLATSAIHFAASALRTRSAPKAPRSGKNIRRLSMPILFHAVIARRAKLDEAIPRIW